MEKTVRGSDQLPDLKVLIDQSIKGNDQSFRKLYNMLAGKMYSLCLRYISDVDNANDAFQDGFTRLYFNLKNYRYQGSFEGWARRVFITTCLDHIKRKRSFFLEIDDASPIEAVQISGLDKLEMADLMKLIQQLPSGQRTIFNLYLVEGYSHKEIAAMLDISESGSKSQLHRAKLCLKILLTDGQD
jgi:RNA polymerase sigma factor (sigma-70 family)